MNQGSHRKPSPRSYVLQSERVVHPRHGVLTHLEATATFTAMLVFVLALSGHSRVYAVIGAALTIAMIIVTGVHARLTARARAMANADGVGVGPHTKK